MDEQSELITQGQVHATAGTLSDLSRRTIFFLFSKPRANVSVNTATAFIRMHTNRTFQKKCGWMFTIYSSHWLASALLHSLWFHISFRLRIPPYHICDRFLLFPEFCFFISLSWLTHFIEAFERCLTFWMPCFLKILKKAIFSESPAITELDNLA